MNRVGQKSTLGPLPPETTFTCPRCGGHTWGSRQVSGPTTTHPGAPIALERECHGSILAEDLRAPCAFQWLDEDDHLWLRKASPA